jgi:hypothetical protein
VYGGTDCSDSLRKLLVIRVLEQPRNAVVEPHEN